MGGTTFMVTVEGKTSQDAFRAAQEKARYEYGHRGYTGTIAEKDSVVMIDLPKGKNARDYADKLIDNRDKRIDDKWGPAGCFDLGKGKYFFFGWASC